MPGKKQKIKDDMMDDTRTATANAGVMPTVADADRGKGDKHRKKAAPDERRQQKRSPEEEKAAKEKRGPIRRG